MAINPAWTDADTGALKSKALDIAQQIVTMRAHIDDLRRIVTDNEVTIGEINDTDGGDPPSPIGPVPKQAIWDVMSFGDQLDLLCSNAVLTDVGWWGPKIGKIVKV